VTNGSASTGLMARKLRSTKATTDLCTVLNTAQMERYMLVGAVRTIVTIWLVAHVRLTIPLPCLSPRHCLSEDGTLSLIPLECFVRAYSCLLRHHPIVADHTREDIRALARKSLQRKLDRADYSFILGSVDSCGDTSPLSLFLKLYDRNSIAHKPPTTQRCDRALKKSQSP